MRSHGRAITTCRCAGVAAMVAVAAVLFALIDCTRGFDHKAAPAVAV
ncbi:MAG: hypothetical protein PGN08_03835 [Sphingomonas taxi]